MEEAENTVKHTIPVGSSRGRWWRGDSPLSFGEEGHGQVGPLGPLAGFKGLRLTAGRRHSAAIGGVQGPGWGQGGKLLGVGDGGRGLGHKLSYLVRILALCWPC